MTILIKSLVLNTCTIIYIYACCNASMHVGVVDNSGLRFYYSTTPRQYNAGLLEIGHNIHPTMIIPPGAEQYTILGFCYTACTDQVIHCFINSII